VLGHAPCHRRFQQWVRAGKLERILRSAPQPDAGRPSVASLPQSLASGGTIRLPPSLSSAGDPLGVPRWELLWHGPPWLHANLVQVSM